MQRRINDLRWYYKLENLMAVAPAYVRWQKLRRALRMDFAANLEARDLQINTLTGSDIIQNVLEGKGNYFRSVARLDYYRTKTEAAQLDFAFETFSLQKVLFQTLERQPMRFYETVLATQLNWVRKGTKYILRRLLNLDSEELNRSGLCSITTFVRDWAGVAAALVDGLYLLQEELEAQRICTIESIPHVIEPYEIKASRDLQLFRLRFEWDRVLDCFYWRTRRADEKGKRKRKEREEKLGPRRPKSCRKSTPRRPKA